MSNTESIIQQTKKWIQEVVIGCNFCPFAAKEVKQGRVRYFVETGGTLREGLLALGRECKILDEDSSVETTLIIIPHGFEQFETYLRLLSLAEKQVEKEGYEGVFQIASFHPHYRFAGAPDDDPANFTNRSVYPMLHILREESIEAALRNFPDPERIPDRNIRFAREKGLAYMKMLWDAASAGERK